MQINLEIQKRVYQTPKELSDILESFPCQKIDECTERRVFPDEIKCSEVVQVFI